MTIHRDMYKNNGEKMNKPNYTPMNRYLLVNRRPSKTKEVEQTVLLPEGYHKTESRYETVDVVSASPNCAFIDRVREGTKIVVLSNFLEDIEVEGHNYTVILENHVMGIIGLVG